MKQYCSKCKTLHNDNEICPHISKQLKNNPNLLAEAANFANIAAQYHLVSSQSLDHVAKGINKILGTNLSYEGSHQYMRDVQVFKQLNSDGMKNLNLFSDPSAAKSYFESSEGAQGILKKKLSGTAQEIDWLRMKQGKLSSILKKSSLLSEEGTNYPGVDGKTINRFTGKTIERVSIKSAQSSSGNNVNVNKVVEAIKKGTLNSDDTVTGVKGTKEALDKALDKAIKEASNNGEEKLLEKLIDAKNNLKVDELNTTDQVKKSTDRLINKVKNGQASANVTINEVSKKAFQGAVIGAAVSLTISSISNYIKYKNGEISEAEAFKEIGEDSVKGIITGGAMGAITIFLPGGAVGFIAGVGIGIYINKTVTNVLDEIFGKGSYAAILDSAGFTYGTCSNLLDSIKKIEQHEKSIQKSIKTIKRKNKSIEKNFNEFEKLMEG